MEDTMSKPHKESVNVTQKHDFRWMIAHETGMFDGSYTIV